MYKPEITSTVGFFNKLAKENYAVLFDKEKDKIESAEKLIDIQCEIASYFVGWWSSEVMSIRKGQRELHPLLFSAFHKNIFNIYAALKLTTSGFYGPARPLMRNVFEYLMISKFSNISNDSQVMKRWYEGETVYFTNSIIKKILVPDPKPFAEFWSIICGFTHATRTATQVSIDINELYVYKDIFINIAVLNALLECNYHLLNTHLITSEYEYMAKFYCKKYKSPRPEYKIPELRKAAHDIFRKNRYFLGRESIKLISAYKRKWKVTSSK